MPEDLRLKSLVDSYRELGFTDEEIGREVTAVRDRYYGSGRAVEYSQMLADWRAEESDLGALETVAALRMQYQGFENGQAPTK